MMKYDNSSVRRQDRLLDQPIAIELLSTGEYGILSLVENQVAGYGIPLNFAWNGENSIYFHCAPEGHKLECLRANSLVSFCVVGSTHVISSKFTTAYQSIIARGEIHLNLSPEERMLALELLLDKYSPQDKVMGLKYAQKSFHRTEIMRLDISTVSGKTKPETPTN